MQGSSPDSVFLSMQNPTNSYTSELFKTTRLFAQHILSKKNPRMRKLAYKKQKNPIWLPFDSKTPYLREVSPWQPSPQTRRADSEVYEYLKLNPFPSHHSECLLMQRPWSFFVNFFSSSGYPPSSGCHPSRVSSPIGCPHHQDVHTSRISLPQECPHLQNDLTSKKSSILRVSSPSLGHSCSRPSSGSQPRLVSCDLQSHEFV